MNSSRKWIVCVVSALFFLFEFVQINLFNTINPFVKESFNLSATQLGFLSSIYFYSTVLFLLPAGQILDKFSPKKVILTTLFLCIVGITTFSLTKDLYIASAARVLEGVGSAFCFLAAFKISSNWFEKDKLAFATSIIMIIGMLGGVLSQYPMEVLVSNVGWRNALLVDGLLGVVIFFLIFLIARDKPIKLDDHKLTPSINSYLKKLKTVYLNRNNWFCGIYTCLMNVPMVLFGALWGTQFLTKIHKIPVAQSSEISGMIFLGTIVGSLFFGYFADFTRHRKLSMLLATVMTGILTLIIIYVPSIGLFSGNVLFFALGLISSSQILGYPTAAQTNPIKVAAMSASVVSFVTMFGYIVFQPLFGAIYDFTQHKGAALDSSFRSGFLIIPICMLVLVFITVFIKVPKK